APRPAGRPPVSLGPGWATPPPPPGRRRGHPAPPPGYVAPICPVVARSPGPRSLLGQVGRRPVPLSWYVSSINPAVARFRGPVPSRGRLGDVPFHFPGTYRRSTLRWVASGLGRPGTVLRPGAVGRPALSGGRALSGRRGTDRAVREGSPPWPFPATSPPHHLALHSGTRAAPSLPGAAYGHGHGTETGGSGARGGVSAAVAARERD